MTSVAQLRVRPQGAQERLLEGILGALATEQPHEEAEDVLPVLGVEVLERGQAHLLHLRF